MERPEPQQRLWGVRRCESESKHDGDDSRKAAGQQNRPLPGASSIRGRVRHDVDVIQKVVLVLVLYVRLRESVVGGDSVHHGTEAACSVDESQVFRSAHVRMSACRWQAEGGRKRVRAIRALVSLWAPTRTQ